MGIYLTKGQILLAVVLGAILGVALAGVTGMLSA